MSAGLLPNVRIPRLENRAWLFGYYRLGRRRRRRIVVSARPNQSLDELTRKYERSLRREEAQLDTTTSPAIYLVEIAEGVCLIAAIALQLAPLVHNLYLKSLPSYQTDTRSEAADQNRDTKMTTAVPTTSSHKGYQLDGFSIMSSWTLIVALVLGSLLRRLYKSQIEAGTRLLSRSDQGINHVEVQEMESSLSRSFSEIAHLASEVEKLRIKVRVMNQQYGMFMESKQAESQSFKSTFGLIVRQLKDTEKQMEEVNSVLDKMQGFASKQFEVVSTALRRIDKECKSLNSRLDELPGGLEIEESVLDVH